MTRARGFSLIEVMVTLVVLSVGLLGIAGLTITSMKNNRSASTRSQATVLVNDIVDRMRANRAVADVPGSPYVLALATAPAVDGSVAKQDLVDWRAAIATSIPAGLGSITQGVNGEFIIVVEWDDSRATSGVANTQLTVRTNL